MPNLQVLYYTNGPGNVAEACREMSAPRCSFYRRRTLDRAFREELSMSPKQYLDAYRSNLGELPSATLRERTAGG